MTQETNTPEAIPDQTALTPEVTPETPATPTSEATDTPAAPGQDDLPVDATPEQRQHWTQKLKAEAEAAKAEAEKVKAEAAAAIRRANDEHARARILQKQAKEAKRKYDIDINEPDRALLAEDPEYLDQFLQERDEAVEARAEVKSQQLRAYKEHVQRCETFGQSTPDFAERVDTIRSDVGNALFPFVVESEVGPQIAYAVGSDPKIQDELASLLGNPMKFAMRVGQITAQAQQPQPSQKPKPAPTLLPPVSSVTGNSGASPRQLSNDEYAKIREKQILEQAR